MNLACVCGLSLQPIGCTSALACDAQRYWSCSCCLWRYISVIPLPLHCDTTASHYYIILNADTLNGQQQNQTLSLTPKTAKSKSQITQRMPHGRGSDTESTPASTGACGATASVYLGRQIAEVSEKLYKFRKKDTGEQLHASWSCDKPLH